MRLACGDNGSHLLRMNQGSTRPLHLPIRCQICTDPHKSLAWGFPTHENVLHTIIVCIASRCRKGLGRVQYEHSMNVLQARQPEFKSRIMLGRETWQDVTWQSIYPGFQHVCQCMTRLLSTLERPKNVRKSRSIRTNTSTSWGEKSELAST